MTQRRSWPGTPRHPSPPAPTPRRLPGAAGLPDILAELQQVRARLQRAASLSDVQLFAQLRTLGELRAALSSLPSDATRRVLQEIETLLESVFNSGRLG